jgi:hypothetical protein
MPTLLVESDVRVKAFSAGRVGILARLAQHTDLSAREERQARMPAVRLLPDTG